MPLIEEMIVVRRKLRSLNNSLLILISMSDIVTEEEKKRLYTLWYIEMLVVKDRADKVIKQWRLGSIDIDIYHGLVHLYQ